MIDIENQVFDRVMKAVKKAYPKAYVTGEYVKSPPCFPCVFLSEIDNAVYRLTQDSSNSENHASVAYELSVYSNLKTGKKSECKKIAGIVDDEMSNLGFTRRFLNPIPNLTDTSVYRITGRYTAVVSKNQVVYRR